MKTKNASPVRQLVPAALFLALAFVLPLLTGQVPKVGNMLCPMHFPVLLCGFVLGGPWGLAVGFAAPLLRSVLFGMPPMFPVAISMAFELATYGLVSGLLWRRAKHTLPALYAVLLTAMVSGRIVWGIVRFVLAGLTGGSSPPCRVSWRSWCSSRFCSPPCRRPALRTDPLRTLCAKKRYFNRFLRHFFQKKRKTGKIVPFCGFLLANVINLN